MDEFNKKINLNNKCNKCNNSEIIIIPYNIDQVLLDYSNITTEKELDFATRLTIEHGIASVPVSPFYKKGEENRTLRFCFAKEDYLLTKAGKLLCTI